MTAEPNFVQACDGPIFLGPATGTLACRCGQALIGGYDPARFLGVSIRCGRCGEVTTTPPLPEGSPPPAAVIIAEPVAEPRRATTPIPPDVHVAGRREYDRIATLFQPHNPEDNVYRISADLLQQVAESYRRLLGTALPDVVLNPDDPFAGITHHALAWSVDEALIEAVKAVVRSSGRKHRGLMAVAPMVLRMQHTPDPHEVRFSYGLFPILNPHYRGAALAGAQAWI